MDLESPVPAWRKVGLIQANLTPLQLQGKPLKLNASQGLKPCRCLAPVGRPEGLGGGSVRAGVDAGADGASPYRAGINKNETLG